MPYGSIDPGCTGLTYYGLPRSIQSLTLRASGLNAPPFLEVPFRPLHELVPPGLDVILAPVATLAPPRLGVPQARNDNPLLEHRVSRG